MKNIFLYGVVFLSLLGCGEEKQPAVEEQQREPSTESVQEAMLTQQQFDALEMSIDTVAIKKLSGYIEANGEVEVPPKNEASVTAVVGANVSDLLVIEGDQVQKGEVLAYLTHPDLLELQTDLANTANEVEFLEKEYRRQKKLFEAGVGSGEDYQKAEAEYQQAQRRLQGLKAQVQLLHLNPNKIIGGELYQKVPVVSPINGAVQAVKVRLGEYVQEQTSMFEILNTHHVHVDLRVFEKDVAKVEVGQKVNFQVASLPGEELQAEIISISKNFEQEPKALHVHAEIDNKPEGLIPGMYVRGKILVSEKGMKALPEGAIAKDGEKFYVFKALPEGEDWSFRPVEVIPEVNEGQWTGIRFLEDIPKDQKFAYNNAYYLMAEMKKGEGGGHHH